MRKTCREIKPLYLYAKEEILVRLDGPALLVAGPGAGCEKRFPLRRISRVVVTGPVSWSTEALLACANQGINVTFLSDNGSARAYWLCRPSTRSSFVQHWRDFLDRPDYASQYAQWRDNMRRRAIRFCALRMGFSDARHKDEAKKILGSGKQVPTSVREMKRKVRGLAQACVMEGLTRVGFCAEEDEIQMLVSDIVNMVQWGLHPEMLEWLTGRGKKVRKTESAVEFFERHIDVAKFHSRDFLHQLSRFLTRQEPI